MLECVVNISEGQDEGLVWAIASAAGNDLLDVHLDPDHHRSVLTLVGEAAPRAVASEAVTHLDLGDHAGAHPRIGVVDVVPFVPLGDATPTEAVAARDAFATWAAGELGLPAYRYGPGSGADVPAGWHHVLDDRSLPEVRRAAAAGVGPDVAGPSPHPTAGAVAVGARPVLVAYNVWLRDPDLSVARAIATDLRSPHVRTLGLQVGRDVQVSMNLVAPDVVGPTEVMDAVAARAAVARCELVGLVPRAVLDAAPTARWDELDLGEDRTIEARLERRAVHLDAST